MTAAQAASSASFAASPPLPVSAIGEGCGEVPAHRSVGYMASLIPRRISQALTGQAVKNPMTMPICIKNQ